MNLIKFKRDTAFRKQFFVPNSLMRIEFMSSVLSMLCKKPIMLTSITFLTSCYQIIKGCFSALRYRRNMVSLQRSTIFDPPTAILTSKVISSKDSKPYSQSSLFQLVVAFLTFGRAKPLPKAVCYKCFTTLKAFICSLVFPMSLPIFISPIGIHTTIRAIAGMASGSKIFTTSYAFNYSISVVCPIHPKYIIPRYTGDVK